MNIQEKQDRAIIRDLAIFDHQEGERPFATEYLAARRKPCQECNDTRKCSCFVCVEHNRGNCLFCNPSPQVVKWRQGGHKGEINA